MEYDFYGMCDDQGEKLKKRLATLQKAFVAEYMKALSLINCTQANENKESIYRAIDDVLFVAFNKADVAFCEAKHKVIDIMAQNL